MLLTLNIRGGSADLNRFRENLPFILEEYHCQMASGNPAADDMLVRALPIDGLTINELEGIGIRTVGQLVHRTELELLDLRNIGSRRVRQIKQALAGLGCTLADEPIVETIQPAVSTAG